jgi:hypothetical protein
MLLLMDTRVTDAGVKKLQQALPNCKIYSDFDGKAGPPGK